jgi:hypothetical protein
LNTLRLSALLLGGRVQHWHTTASSRGVCRGEQWCRISAIDIRRRERKAFEHLEMQMRVFRVRTAHRANDLTRQNPLPFPHFDRIQVRVKRKRRCARIVVFYDDNVSVALECPVRGSRDNDATAHGSNGRARGAHEVYAAVPGDRLVGKLSQTVRACSGDRSNRRSNEHDNLIAPALDHFAGTIIRCVESHLSVGSSLHHQEPLTDWC